jgi:hypothetical protein
MKTPNLSRQQITNLLTAVIVGAWVIFAITRIWVDIPQAIILDNAMPIVIGYWFVSSALTVRKNGNGNGSHEYVGEHRLT